MTEQSLPPKSAATSRTIAFIVAGGSLAYVTVVGNFVLFVIGLLSFDLVLPRIYTGLPAAILGLAAMRAVYRSVVRPPWHARRWPAQQAPRSVMKWCAAVLSLIIVVIWWTGFRIGIRVTDRFGVALWNGSVVSAGGVPAAVDRLWEVFGPSGSGVATYLLPEAHSFARAGNAGLVILPLWLFFVPSAYLFLVFWYSDRRRLPPGHCQACGYDLIGNTSGRCPECGTPTA